MVRCSNNALLCPANDIVQVKIAYNPNLTASLPILNTLGPNALRGFRELVNKRAVEYLGSKPHPELINPNLSNMGPFRWDRRPGHYQNWYGFRPSFVTSSQGLHIIKLPCSPAWWENRRKKYNCPSSGYGIALPYGMYVFEGWYPAFRQGEHEITEVSLSNFRKRKKRVDVRSRFDTMGITRYEDDSTVATFNGFTSITFSDGKSFKIKMNHRTWVPFVSPGHFEFFDEQGRRQFYFDRKRNIWLDRDVDFDHLLMLIAAERYLDELNNLMAVG